jgi:pimeloyl-ACP methyl ester carboxylesterase
MPTAACDGIETRYEVTGSGPPLLLFSPGGFNATVENWTSFGIYKRLDLLAHLSDRFTCIAFDKRESGASGGRVEPLTWDAYARQGAALLDHLAIERAHLMGGCIGCSIALQFAVAWPERADRLVLYSPAGGPRYRLTQHERLLAHLSFVVTNDLSAVVDLARETEQTFAQDPRVGPWVSVLRRDARFADAYARQDSTEYRRLIEHTAGDLFMTDAVPGPLPEQLFALERPALIAPGNDASHALSAAHYLRECLPQSELWEVLPEQQTAENAPQQLVSFLEQ